MNPSRLERRSSLRLAVNAPIRIRTVNSVLPGCYAELVNISKTGAYIATWHRYREGDSLLLWTDVATRNWSLSPEWRCVGQVVRVRALDPRAHALGIAVWFESEFTGREALPAYPSGCVA